MHETWSSRICQWHTMQFSPNARSLSYCLARRCFRKYRVLLTREVSEKPSKWAVSILSVTYIITFTRMLLNVCLANHFYLAQGLTCWAFRHAFLLTMAIKNAYLSYTRQPVWAFSSDLSQQGVSVCTAAVSWIIWVWKSRISSFLKKLVCLTPVTTLLSISSASVLVSAWFYALHCCHLIG